MNWNLGFKRLYIVLTGACFVFIVVYGFPCIIRGFDCPYAVMVENEFFLKLDGYWPVRRDLLVAAFGIWLFGSTFWFAMRWVIQGFRKDKDFEN